MFLRGSLWNTILKLSLKYAVSFESFTVCVNGINVLMNIPKNCSNPKTAISKNSFPEIPVVVKLGINWNATCVLKYTQSL